MRGNPAASHLLVAAMLDAQSAIALVDADVQGLSMAANRLIDARPGGTPPLDCVCGTDALLAAGKIVVNRALRFVAQSAVQSHGTMGMAEELPVGRFFRRPMRLSWSLVSLTDPSGVVPVVSVTPYFWRNLHEYPGGLP